MLGARSWPESRLHIKSLQWQAFHGNHKEQTHAWERLKTLANDLAEEVNVYPPKYAGLTDDMRIVVNTPWFKQKVEAK